MEALSICQWAADGTQGGSCRQFTTGSSEAATISLLSAWQNVLAICNADKILTNGLYTCLKKLPLDMYALESCMTLSYVENFSLYITSFQP